MCGVWTSGVVLRKNRREPDVRSNELGTSGHRVSYRRCEADDAVGSIGVQCQGYLSGSSVANHIDFDLLARLLLFDDG